MAGPDEVTTRCPELQTSGKGQSEKLRQTSCHNSLAVFPCLHAVINILTGHGKDKADGFGLSGRTGFDRAADTPAIRTSKMLAQSAVKALNRREVIIPPRELYEEAEQTVEVIRLWFELHPPRWKSMNKSQGSCHPTRLSTSDWQEKRRV